MLKKYYTEPDEIKAFVDRFHQKSNKLLTTHTRKKLTKILTQITESPYVSSQHELLCCSSPGLTADIQIEGMDNEGVIHVSLANRRGRDGERHVIHYDSYRVPFRYIRPHSYTCIADTLAKSLFPDGLSEDRVEMWTMQIANALSQHSDITEPVSHGGYIEDKYLAFDYHFPLLKVTAAINDCVIVKEFCLDEVSHTIGMRATLGSYVALQETLDRMDVLCQQDDTKKDSTRSSSRGSSPHLTRQANRLIDLLRVLRRLTQRTENELKGHLVTLLEDTHVSFGDVTLTVVPETTPTIRLVTRDGEWVIALATSVIIELTGQDLPTESLPVVPVPASVDDEYLNPVETADFTSEQNKPLNHLVQQALTRSGVYVNEEGGIDPIRLYQVLETSLNETGPILGWFRQKGIYVKYRVKQRPHPVLPTLLIKVDIIKEQPVKRNLVNIDIEVGRHDVDELSYVWKMLWMSLIMQADCP